MASDFARRHGWQNSAHSVSDCLGPETRSVGHRQSQSRESCHRQPTMCVLAKFVLAFSWPVPIVYTHPLVLLAWTLLSLAFVHFMNWWPSSYRSISGIFRYLIPLPAFASVAVPIMFLIDWWDLTHNPEKPRYQFLFIGRTARISKVALRKSSRREICFNP